MIGNGLAGVAVGSFMSLNFTGIVIIGGIVSVASRYDFGFIEKRELIRVDPFRAFSKLFF